MTWKDWVENETNKKITSSEAIHPSGINERDYFISGFCDAFKIMEELNFPYDKTILEYGCGNSRILRHLKEYDAYGVDIVPDFVEESRDLGCNAYELKDLEILVDIVYSYTVFIHLKKDECREALKYIYDKLKPDGLAYLQIPIYDSNRTGCSFIDINTFDEKTFKKMVDDEGFEILSMIKSEGVFDYSNIGVNHDKFQVLKKKDF